MSQFVVINNLVLIATGLFTGSFVTLFSVYAILAHISGMFSPGTEADYVETVYPVFRYVGRMYVDSKKKKKNIIFMHDWLFVCMQHVCIVELAPIHVRVQSVLMEGNKD